MSLQEKQQHVLSDDLKESSEAAEHSEHYSAPSLTADDVRTGSGVVVTEEDDRRIRRATDMRIMPVLIWIYFLQIFDKTLLGYAATYGLRQDAHLVGTQYSTIGSMNAIAQLVWLPFSSWLIVRVPPRTLMATLVFCWGAAELGMAFSTNYGALVATRFLLGLFEAACLPLFAVITAQWYRRSEQPLRVAIWYGTNGIATIIAAFMSYGLGQIKNSTLYSWQYIFLIGALLTIVSPALIWWRLDNDIQSARFLSDEDKIKGLERLKSNQTGVGSTEFRWRQGVEALIEPKTYLWLGMSITLNVGAAVTNVFGPVILQTLPIQKKTSTLMNAPFGALQTLAIIFASYAAYKFKVKSGVLLALVVPVIVGIALLYTLPHTSKNTGPLLLGYYLLSSLFGGNPLIVSWMIANTSGQTKKTVVVCIYNMGSAVGNIVGPLLFNAKDAPYYKPGLRGVLGCFIALAGIIVLTVVNLMFLNKMHSRSRVKEGKSAKIIDRSMDTKFHAHDASTDVEGQDTAVAGDHMSDLELTDKKNNQFVYVL